TGRHHRPPHRTERTHSGVTPGRRELKKSPARSNTNRPAEGIAPCWFYQPRCDKKIPRRGRNSPYSSRDQLCGAHRQFRTPLMSAPAIETHSRITGIIASAPKPEAADVPTRRPRTRKI